MAAPPYLCARSGNGGLFGAAFRAPGGSILNQIGNTFGSADENTNATCFWSNRVCEYEGDLYVWHQNQIRKYNSGTGDWDLVYTVPSQNNASGYGFHSGLYVLTVNGAPQLMGVYRLASTNRTTYLNYDGSTWTTGLIEASSQTILGEVFVYRDTLFIMGGLTPFVFQYDPTNNTTLKITPAGVTSNPSGLSYSFAVLNNVLYMVGIRDDTANSRGARLWRFESGAFVDVQALGTTIVASGLYQYNWLPTLLSHFAFWSDGTNLYCIVRGSSALTTNSGWYCFKLVPNGSMFTETDLTDPVIPSSLRQGSLATTDRGQWWTNKDIDTDPTSPDVYFYYQQDDDTKSVIYYEWVDDTTQLADGSSVGAFGLAMPQGQATSGEYTWSSGEWNVQIESIAQGASGLTISFKAWGTGNKSVKFFYSFDEETPTNQCTLVGSATGGSAVRSANQVNTVNADGSTTYTITWDFFTDGAFVGGRFALMPHIF